MRAFFLVLLAGALFGAGLTVSGMVNPTRVQNFLDLFGTWDPTLIFVMAGGVAVTFVGYRLAFRRGAPLFAERFSLPTVTAIDWPLMAGAVIFGIGWGLSGFCPGPAVAGLVFGAPKAYIFLAAMLAGILAARALRRHTPTAAELAAVEG